MDGPPSPLAPPPEGPPGAPAVPKSPVGGPGGPGGSPMLSPGGGAGNKAAAVAQIKAAHEALLIASMAFESGGKEQNAVLEAVRSLRIFGKAEGTNLVPAALATMAQANKQGQLSAAPPPGLVSNNSPPPGMGSPPPEGAAA
jgi:hypothetical protein